MPGVYQNEKVRPNEEVLASHLSCSTETHMLKN